MSTMIIPTVTDRAKLPFSINTCEYAKARSSVLCCMCLDSNRGKSSLSVSQSDEYSSTTSNGSFFVGSTLWGSMTAVSIGKNRLSEIQRQKTKIAGRRGQGGMISSRIASAATLSLPLTGDQITSCVSVVCGETHWLGTRRSLRSLPEQGFSWPLKLNHPKLKHVRIPSAFKKTANKGFRLLVLAVGCAYGLNPITCAQRPSMRLIACKTLF